MFSVQVKQNKQHSKLVPGSVKTIEKCFWINKFNQWNNGNILKWVSREQCWWCLTPSSTRKGGDAFPPSAVTYKQTRPTPGPWSNCWCRERTHCSFCVIMTIHLKNLELFVDNQQFTPIITDRHWSLSLYIVVTLQYPQPLTEVWLIIRKAFSFHLTLTQTLLFVLCIINKEPRNKDKPLDSG